MSGLAGRIGNITVRAETLVDVFATRGNPPLSRWDDGSAVMIATQTTGVPAARPHRSVTGLRLAGDLRLDNRTDLAVALARPHLSEDDAALAAEIYRRWGVAGLGRLEGDFALAIWDPATATLCLARDTMGVRPLFYVANENGIAFASDPRPLRVQPSPAQPETGLAAFLAGLPEYPRTLDQGICRVLPGEAVVWRAGANLRRHRHNEIAPETPPSEISPAARFRDLFEAAVAARMREGETVAAMLSGGLDSSSIAMVAADHRKPLPVYSGIFPSFPELDERTYIRAVQAAGSFVPVEIDHSDHAPMLDLDAALDEQGMLFMAPGLPISRTLYHRAAADGVQVLLDGHGGDEVAWHGSTRLLELAAAGQWMTVLRLLPTWSRIFGNSTFHGLAALMHLHPPHSLPGRAARRAVRRLAALQPGSGARGELQRPAWQKLLRPELIAAADLETRMQRASQPSEACLSSDRANHLHALTAPLFSHALEVLDRTSTAAGTEARYPFLDRRLTAFCLGLPAAEKLRPGQSRSILRRGLAGTLPDRIARRQDKVSFIPFLRSGLLRHHGPLLDAMARDVDGRLGALLQIDALRVEISDLRSDPQRFDGDRTLTLWRAALLHVWIGRQCGHVEAA